MKEDEEMVTAEDMIEKLGLLKRDKFFLFNVIWRNWILPIIITVAFAVPLMLVFHLIPDNVLTTDFLAGWLSLIVWEQANKRYAI